MPIEQRVISSPTAKVGQTPKITPRQRNVPVVEEPAAPAGGKKISVKVVILSVLLVVVLAAGAGYWFVLRPSMAAAEAERGPVAGIVHTVESINVNLSDGHYLRLGFAVQLTDQALEVDGSQILDTAISLYSGQKYADVLDPTVREALKQQLAAQLDTAYDGQVMDVYFTDYVAQ